jgi:AMP nucleosidase
MIAGGVKTSKSDEKVTKNFSKTHLEIGIDALLELKNKGLAIKHLRF